jgi:hypothetical protein
MQKTKGAKFEEFWRLLRQKKDIGDRRLTRSQSRPDRQHRSSAFYAGLFLFLDLSRYVKNLEQKILSLVI